MGDALRLRHTAARLLATGHVGVHAAAAILGNDPAVYLRTYAHLYPHDLRRAAGTLDRTRAHELTLKLAATLAPRLGLRQTLDSVQFGHNERHSRW